MSFRMHREVIKMKPKTTTLRRLVLPTAVLAIVLVLALGAAIGQEEEEMMMDAGGGGGPATPATASPVSAAASVLQSRLTFFYVANPQANPRYPAEVLDDKAIAAGTFSGAFFSNARMAPLQAMVKALLCTPDQGGDLRLQEFTYQILSLSTKPVAHAARPE